MFRTVLMLFLLILFLGCSGDKSVTMPENPRKEPPGGFEFVVDGKAETETETEIVPQRQ